MSAFPTSDNAVTLRVASRFLALTPKTAKVPSMGETVDSGKVRIHRYRDSTHITDLTNAGKRGKKCQLLVITPPHRADYEGEEDFGNLLAGFLGNVDSMNAVEVALDAFMEKHPEDAEGMGVRKSEDLRGVDVMPAGFAPIRVRGKFVDVRVEGKDFQVSSVLDENINGTTCIPGMKGGAKTIPAFYRWVKDNQAGILSMTFADMLAVMHTLGVQYHQYCSID